MECSGHNPVQSNPASLLFFTILFKMGLNVFLRDNINAMSFNILIICALDIIAFLVMFILVIPLPDTLRRSYAGV